MNNHLLRSDQSKEFFTNERCHILEMLHNHDVSKPFSIAKGRVEPGITTAWHGLKGITEYYYILEGNGMMEIDEGEAFEVRKNDLIRILPNEPQRITNIGEEDLSFLLICNPPFTDANYEDYESS